MFKGKQPSAMQHFVKSHKAVIQVFSAVTNLQETIREEEVDRPQYGVFNLESCKVVIFQYFTFKLSVFT